MSLHESTHWLKCRHQIGRNGYDYYMPCNVLKNMSGGKLKIEVFGFMAKGGNGRRIRYVYKYRVRIREHKEAKR